MVDDRSKLKLSHKQWKKLKRKQKRQAIARQQKGQTCSSEETDGEDGERQRREVEEENDRQNAQWQKRDQLAHQQWLDARAQEEAEKKKREEAERKIREEWEEREKRLQEEQERQQKDEAQRRESQDSLLKKATENEHKEWHNPLAPTHYNDNSAASNGETVYNINKCPFFAKTGACRFGERCSRQHPRPDSGTTLLIPGMFINFELMKSSIDDYDTDINLEYEDSELYRSFQEFYHDVVPEFKSVGRIVNFKVCCNHEQHLRGNVYVQYKRESEAHDAYVKFNARWYAGRQLSCQFVDIPKWKAAICGLFFAKRCPKGKACNFLHVFRNPGNEFWEADRDFEHFARNERHDTPKWHSFNRWSCSHRKRSRSSRSRSPSPKARQGRRRQSAHQSRSRSRSREKSLHKNHKSSRKGRYRHRSRSRSRSRSTVRRHTEHKDSETYEQHNSSPSRSTESNCDNSEEEQYKKSKHKKSKKSSKKKKKHKSKSSVEVDFTDQQQGEGIGDNFKINEECVSISPFDTKSKNDIEVSSGRICNILEQNDSETAE